MHYFDTHAHLNDPSLKSNLAQYLAEAQDVGVINAMAIGIDLKSSYECLEIANQYPGIYASVGIHPNSCNRANDFHWSEICKLISNEKVVAIGETGLDCYWDDCRLEIQKDWFDRHIELSHETGLPIVVHLRDSENEILDSLKSKNCSGSVNGIMHSFTGSLETAERCLEYGMYISFAGMVTFKNAQAIRDVAKRIPDDRILIETDSPYLTPDPHRGKRPNHPAMVVHTAECLAKLRGVTVEAFAELTKSNAERVFALNTESTLT